MNQRDESNQHPTVVAGRRPAVTDGGDEAGRSEADALLDAVERDVVLLDDMDTTDQVAEFDRVHTALAEALAQTAETGGPSGQEHPGA